MDDYDDYFQTDAPEGEAASADSRHEGGGSARAAGARSESAASDRAASGGRAANGSIRQPALAKPAFDDPDVKSSANPSGGQPRGPGHPRGEEDARRDRDDAGTSSEDRGASPGGGDDPTDPHRDQGHERADARRRTREEIEAEPEDNFGAGIFP
jgi:hypothetical protein